VQKVASVADPWVDSVDYVVTGAWKTVNAKVIDPARKKNPEGKISIFGVAAEVSQVAAVEIQNRYAHLLDKSDHAVENLLPETEAKQSGEDKKKHVQSLVEVGNKAQKRVLKRLDRQLQSVKAFSAGRLKDIVHVDLFLYAEKGYSASLLWTNDNVVPIANRVTSSGKQVFDSINSQVSVVGKASSEKLHLLWQAITKYRDIALSKGTEYRTYVTSQGHSLYLSVSATVKDSFITLKGFFVPYYSSAHAKALDGVKLAEEKVKPYTTYVQKKAEDFGVPKLVGKAKEVSLGEVSDYFLIKLNIKEKNEEFVIVEQKLVDLFRTLLGLILLRDRETKKSAELKPPSKKAPTPGAWSYMNQPVTASGKAAKANN